MDQATGGLGLIWALAILILALSPYIIMAQLGGIWKSARRSELHLQRIEKHLADAAKERKDAAQRLAASLGAEQGRGT